MAAILREAITSRLDHDARADVLAKEQEQRSRLLRRLDR
jgi:hypothetical protein